MRIFIIICILFSFGFITVQEKNKIDSIESEKASLAFSELKEILQEENGQLWNYSLQGPVIFVNRETRIVYANEPDLKGEFIKTGSIYIGKLPEKINIANTATDWNGKRWTMVALPLPEIREKRLNLLIHECFHRIQPAIGFDSINEIQSTHFDSKDGRIYLKLELEALKQAIQSDNPEKHIKNALSFRYYRYQLFPSAKKSEYSLEINEGVAEYTGSILSQRNAIELKKHYISKIDMFYNTSFVRSFAYLTIPMYGFCMQLKDKKWNLRITKNTNLTDFISSFYGVNAITVNQEKISEISKLYGIDTILKDENDREKKQIERNNEYRKMFLGDSVLLIDLDNKKVGFNPLYIIPFDSLGTIFPIMRVTDNWGILEVDSCGVLMNKDWTKITATYPRYISDTLILGNGWKLKLDELWKLDKINKTYRIIKK